ncbi:elongin A, like [Nematolebias whitei]|uniref:elongin A, like n=1 Tax=Nematolebias whitei TaxID=451745 RepID=UPI00189AF9B3|nr:elongin A, like [Nematolebias whitei]
MARRSDVAKKIMQFKLQLSDTSKPATVLKVLQKLKDLDVTLDILAETGIGKTVNSLRRHKQAGELAKSLVQGWKKLVPKQSTSHGENRCLQEAVSIKTVEDDQSSPENGYSSNEDEQNDCLSSNGKNQTATDDDSFKTRSRKNDLDKGRSEEKGRKSKDDKNTERNQQGSLLQKNILMSKAEIQDDKTEKKKKKRSEALLADENVNEGPQKSRSDSRVKLKSSNGNGSSASEQKSKSKSPKESSMESKDFLSFSDKPSKKLKEAKDGRSFETSTSSETQRRKRKKNKQEKHDRLKYKPDSENNEHSKRKKAKMERNEEESKSDEEEPSLSFESYLNYDVNLKRKDQSGVKKAPKTIKNVTKGQTKTPDMDPSKPPASSPDEKRQESLMHLMDVPLPAALPELEKPSSIDYYLENKGTVSEKEPDFCDEESAVFTGQRLNSKMQVYSGAKTLFLPAMMSLYQQCIRTLQNNINLLYETGGVPFELLEPVLERCTPEQLLRIEEYNPIYMGLTDHLWGKHCQRDFKDCRLQEYESWKEMYIRVSEERERKLQRLTKSIVSAHSKKPKGRQVKMAFIHTVAKPPRDVRIQQEIHGTAVQQPHLLKCSVKGQENQTRTGFNEPNRPSSTSSGGSNNQDARKKTRVAPMMAKSLKAFKKQLGRR